MIDASRREPEENRDRTRVYGPVLIGQAGKVRARGKTRHLSAAAGQVVTIRAGRHRLP